MRKLLTLLLCGAIMLSVWPAAAQDGEAYANSGETNTAGGYSFCGGNFAPGWEVSSYSDFSVEDSSLGKSVAGYQNWDRINRAEKSLSTPIIAEPEDEGGTNRILSMRRFASSTGNERPYVTTRETDGSVRALSGMVYAGMRLRAAEAADKPFTVVVRDGNVPNYWTNGAYMAYLSFAPGGSLSAVVDRGNPAGNTDLGTYPLDEWFELVLELDTETRSWRAYLNGSPLSKQPLSFYWTEAQGKDRGDIAVIELDIQKEGTQGLWYADDVAIWQDRTAELAAASEELTESALTGEALDAVTKDLSLPESIGGCEINWTSDNPGAVDKNGVVTRQPYAQTAVLTATLTYDNNESLAQKAQHTKSFTVTVAPGETVVRPGFRDGNFPEEWEVYSYSDFDIPSDKLGSSVYGYGSWDLVNRVSTTLTSTIVIDPTDAEGGHAERNRVMKMHRIAPNTGNERPYTVVREQSGGVRGVSGKVRVGMRLRAEKAAGIFTVVIRDSNVPNYYTNGQYLAYLSFGSNGQMRSVRQGTSAYLANYPIGEWFELELELDTVSRSYNVFLDGKQVNAETLGFYFSEEGKDSGKVAVVEMDIQKETQTESIWYADDVAIWQDRTAELLAAAEELTEASLTDEPVSALTHDLTLPGLAGGFGVRYSSDNPAAVADDGTVVRKHFSQSVCFTAEILYAEDVSNVQNAKFGKMFTLTTAPLSGDDETVLAEIAEYYLTETLLTSESLTSVTKDLNKLPAEGPDGTAIAWASDNETALSADGTVQRPEPGAGDQTVHLTATLSRNGKTLEKIFTVTVLATPSVEEILDQACETLTLSLITYEPASSITSDLFLVDRVGGAQISWSSDRPEIIDSSGRVFRGETEEAVVLTATVSYGGMSRSKTFELRVLIDPQVKLTADAAALSLEHLAQVTAGFDLPTVGSVYGCSIRWTSSNTDAITINGGKAAVTRNEFEDGDAVVTLTARLSCEGKTEERQFKVTVLKLPSDISLVEAVYNSLTLSRICAEDPQQVTKNLALEASFADGVNCEWSSSRPDVVAPDGQVTNPPVGSSSAAVTLTARIYKRNAEMTRSFQIVVQPFGSTEEILARAKDSLTFSVISREPIQAVTENLSLCRNWLFGTSVEWISSDDAIVIGESGGGWLEGLISRPPGGSGIRTASLQAVISLNGQQVIKNFLIGICESESYTDIYRHDYNSLKIGDSPQQGEGNFSSKPSVSSAKVAADPAGGDNLVSCFYKPAGVNPGYDYFTYYSHTAHEGLLTMGGRFYMPDDYADSYFCCEGLAPVGAQLPIFFYSDGTVRADIVEDGVTKRISTAAPVFDKGRWNEFRLEIDTAAKFYHIYINNACVSEDGGVVFDGKPYSTWQGIPYRYKETSVVNSIQGYRLSLAPAAAGGETFFYLDDLYMKKQATYSAALETAFQAFERAFLQSNRLENITGDLILPELELGNVNCAFYSSDSARLSPDGTVKRPDTDAQVVWTAVFTLGGESIRRDYPLVIKGMEDETAVQHDLADALKKLRESVNLQAIIGDIDLPETGVYGSRLSMKSSRPDILDTDGKVSRSKEDVSLTLTIRAEKGEYSAEESVPVVVKAQPTGSTDAGTTNDGGVNVVYGGSGSRQPSGIIPKPEQAEKMHFDDLAPEHWAYEAVRVLYEKGIVRGIDEKSFAPDRGVTRGEFAKLLVCTLDLKPVGGEIAFLDVPEDNWCYQYIRILAGRGIVTGQDSDYFGLNEPVSRQDMAVMLQRAMENCGLTLAPQREAVSFADENAIGGYAKEAVTALYRAGLMNGMTENEFGPLGGATRAQAASLLYRVYSEKGGE